MISGEISESKTERRKAAMTQTHDNISSPKQLPHHRLPFDDFIVREDVRLISGGWHVCWRNSLTFVWFPLSVLCKNKTSLETADHAPKFKIAGHLFNIMTSSFMTMTNNWTSILDVQLLLDTLDFFQKSLSKSTKLGQCIQTNEVSRKLTSNFSEVSWFCFQLIF